MELTFKDLKSREVINLTDGRSLGHITNLSINFPSGKLAGIIVPERKKGCIAGLFDKSELFIDVKRILKIGNDVILVDLKCGDTCGDSVSLKTPPPRPDNKPCGPNNCPPPTCEQLFGDGISDVRFDGSDY